MAKNSKRKTLFVAEKYIKIKSAAIVPAYNPNQKTVAKTQQQNREQICDSLSLKGFEFQNIRHMDYSA